MEAYQVISFDNPVFSCYATYAGLLVVKMLVMAFLTGLQRYRKKAYATPEDAARVPGAAIVLDDPDVERVRRAHLNDLENILPFFAVGFVYVLTNPNVYEGTILIRIVAWARILHTIVYAVYPIRQPARAICFFLALLPTLYMSFVVMVKWVHF